MRNGIKTEFSFRGLFAAAMSALPFLLTGRSIIYHDQSILSVLSAVAGLYLFLSIVFLKNEKASPFSRKNRIFSIASICYGICFLLTILYLIGKCGYLAAVLSHAFAFLFLIFYSIDRKNWFSLSASSLSLIIALIRDTAVQRGLL